MKLFKGYVPTKNKKCLIKFKNLSNLVEALSSVKKLVQSDAKVKSFDIDLDFPFNYTDNCVILLNTI